MRDEFVEMDPATVETLLTRLSRVDPLAARFHAVHSIKPERRSPAWYDAQKRNGHLSWAFGGLSITVAVDHMRTWLLLALGRRLTERGPITLGRGSLESSVTCRWLLDPKQDHSERIRRACAIQLQDYRYRADVEARASITTQNGSRARPADERAAMLRREMGFDGVAEIVVPSMTDRFAEYSVGGWFYGLLSAFAHGRQWAMLLSDLGERKSIPGVPGIKAVRVTANDALMLQVASAVSLGLLGAVESFEWYVRASAKRS